jgi:hypothetical protein
LKLKKADETAVVEGGSSDSNIQSSVDEVKWSEEVFSSLASPLVPVMFPVCWSEIQWKSYWAGAIIRLIMKLMRDLF